jgi:hypothetical protein
MRFLPRFPATIPGWRASVRAAAAIVSSLAFSSSPAGATTVVAPDFSALVAEARLIARVQVRAVRAIWAETPDGRVIKTLVTFAVQRPLKGAPAGELTLTFLGGELDGQAMHIEGMPRFEAGQTDILFVSDTTGARFSPLVGLMHGRYRVEKDRPTARAYIARDDRVPLESEHDVQLPQRGARLTGQTPRPATALTVADFEAKIIEEAARHEAAR